MFLKDVYKSWKFYATVLTLVLIAFAAMRTARPFLHEDSQPVSITEPTADTIKPFPEDFSLRLERMAAPPTLTDEEIEEENRIEEEQVVSAIEWLESADPQQRVVGAEQLSAYPTAEAEQRLVEALANDVDPDVRSTAARSLGLFKQLQAKTLDSLLQALETDDEEVRLDVLNTLQAVVEREPYGAKQARRIIKKLIKIAKSGQLQTNSQSVLSDFLTDQAPGWQK